MVAQLLTPFTHTISKTINVYSLSRPYDLLQITKAFELLFEHPYSKIEYVVERLGVERKSASRYLKQLESIGILDSQKIGRETIYINTELIEILKRN